MFITTCNHSLEANINEDGSGYINPQTISGGGCIMAACDEGGNSPHANIPWAIETAELFPTHLTLGVPLCVRSVAAAEGRPRQPVVSPWRVSELTSHDYRLTADGAHCLEGVSTEVFAIWTLDAPNIEITHL